MADAGDILIDGVPAKAADLTHVALVNYGAYTSFRVEKGRVRGLDLHIERLEASALELFGETVGEPRLRAFMRAAVGDRRDCWLRVSLFSPEMSPRQPAWTGRPKVMTATFPPPPPLADSLRLQTQVYAREAAHLKHVATFGLIRARRAARAAGFDDALFVDAEGRVSEGSLWNIGFIRGREVLWPQAPMLAGVAQALVQRGLEGVGLTGVTAPLTLADLSSFDAAFICNSATPACPVASIDGLSLGPAPLEALNAAWASQPCQPI
ncbi:branched-subunit amino acid aminotransferase/4-amino-4-deoxychorismate lyase [Brevundimonas alba]|uniref:Probable branched-chain-amino-acid aminotransferase n=1 Tax=Brevundimonas alba TaxID=74314 RepID=A0A7X5YKY5_9CAUL|nr:aminotransferase class IV [Brevundimonas alba]NJC41847.1 branched-subunit amino acid aminotransferase/4-amino-4-deoxychorismate lyase [Brevundimonas alba]